MIETITPTGCGGRRGQHAALVLFVAGASASAAAVGALLGKLGSGLGSTTPRAVGAAMALLGALAALGIVRRVPQGHWQVPEQWRRTWPTVAWAPSYGAILGTGVATFQPIGAGWVFWGMAVASGNPTLGALCGVFFALGRGVMVLPALSSSAPHAAAQVSAIAAPATRGIGLAFGVIALTLVPLQRAAAETGRDLVLTGNTTARTLGDKGSPYVRVDVTGAGSFIISDASSPSLDGPLLAVKTPDGIGVIRWTSPSLRVEHRLDGPITSPSLAWPYLAYREGHSQRAAIRVRNLQRGTDVIVSGFEPRGEIGRPAMRGRLVLWHVSGPKGSQLRAAQIGSRRGPTPILTSRIRSLRDPTIGQARIAWISETASCGEVWVAPIGGGPSRLVHSQPVLAGRLSNLQLSRGEVIATLDTPGVEPQAVRYPISATASLPCVASHPSPLLNRPRPLLPAPR